MNKIAVILVPLVLLACIPIAAAVLVMAVAGPAAGEQLRTVACGTGIPTTGEWRPPFTQSYTVSRRGFGREFHPIHLRWEHHSGQDLSSQPGPGPVVAIGSGRVSFAGLSRTGYGNYVDVVHAGGVTSRYAHLARIDVRHGQAVTSGERLGVEGSTGTSTGNHLHLEILVAGVATDPVPWMLAHGAPLNGHAVTATPSIGFAAANGAVAGGAGDTGGTAARVRGATAGVMEGGIGFELPAPGNPRQASLRNPPLPIPDTVKGLYQAAAARYAIPWTLLAGIGMEETGHGRTSATSSAGAQGLMQFMPATFAAVGVDGDGDGIVDIRNDADSITSAANYLVRSGGTDGPDGVTKALYAYNHATWYINDVLYYAHAYGGGIVLGDPTGCDTPALNDSGDPTLPPLASDRVRQLLQWAGSQAGDAYVMGANGPNAWDCSSLVQAAFALIGISMPRTAGAQRAWLAAGNGFRVRPGTERPGDVIFWDSYLGPSRIGHVMLVWNPVTRTTIEARSRSLGVGHFSYAAGPSHHIFEIWRVGNMADQPTVTK